LDKNDLKVNFIESNIGEILKAKKRKDKIACSLCAKLKKAIITKEAKKLGCNKIAFGHHIDDAIETLFMNMIGEGRIATFSPFIDFNRNQIELIRPFILTREEDITSAAKKYQIPIIKNACPLENLTRRTYIKNFLETNFYKNKNFKNCYINFQQSLLNGKQSNL